jgi:hypothetical protein
MASFVELGNVIESAIAGVPLTVAEPCWITWPLWSACDVILCGGESPEAAQWMVPFRAGLEEYLTTVLPDIRVEWLETGHMLVLSKAKETAALINEFAAAQIG